MWLGAGRAFESAGVEFIDENGGGPGVRLHKRTHKKPGKVRAVHPSDNRVLHPAFEKGPTFSPWPMMERASEPPMLLRLCCSNIGRTLCAYTLIVTDTSTAAAGDAGQHPGCRVR
jgi:hypothetical protein